MGAVSRSIGAGAEAQTRTRMWSCWRGGAQRDGGRRGERQMRAERKGAAGVWGAGGWGKGATSGKGFFLQGQHTSPASLWDVATCSLLSHIPPMPPLHSQDTDVKHIPWAAVGQGQAWDRCCSSFWAFSSLPREGVCSESRARP